MSIGPTLVKGNSLELTVTDILLEVAMGTVTMCVVQLWVDGTGTQRERQFGTDKAGAGV